LLGNHFDGSLELNGLNQRKETFLSTVVNSDESKIRWRKLSEISSGCHKETKD